MSFQRKEMGDARGGNNSRNESRQNGNASSFRTDSAISGARNMGERPLQKWQSETPADLDGSLESMRLKPSSGGAWDQFAENERRFGLKTDYNEDIYTTKIDKSHPMYKQRLADAERKAREIERSITNNAHVAEERIQDHVGGDDNGGDEEDKYSGVRRQQQQQDFPPLTPSNNKYTPPARRAPTGQSTVSGAPVDPAIISSQLRPEKPAPETSKSVPVPPSKATKTEVETPPTTAESSFAANAEPKAAAPSTSTSASRTTSPQAKPDATANATATVERDVSQAFKTFAVQQRKNVDQLRLTRIRNDKEIKLNDLKKFADSFKLTTPVPSDLVSIIAKDPAKQKEIQEKAKRNAEESKANPEAVKPIVPVPDAKSAQRPHPTAHVSSPSNPSNRQNAGRNTAFTGSAAYRGSSQTPPQPIPNQQSRASNLARNMRSNELNHNNKISQPSVAHEARLPPTGPANGVDPSFSRRSSGVASAQGARLNPTSSEFRPSPHAATFSPHPGPSTGSSPRSVVNAPAPAPITRPLIRRKPTKPSERAKLTDKFDALSHIKTLKPGPEKKWDANGGMKPAYDTHPAWRLVVGDEKPDSTMQLTYTKLFEMAPFPAQPMSPPGPAHVMPQQPHQHQLPFHLQQNVHNMQQGRSPRAPPMNLHGSQLGHGPVPPFNNHDEHRMMPSHSAQSYGSPRIQNVNMAYPPMNHAAQMTYNPQMMPYGAPPMQPPFRSLSQNHQFIPQQGPMGPIMMQNTAGGFLTSQGMAPGPQMMYPQGQAPFMPPGNGHPPPIQPNGFPSSPGRGAAPMMMSQGSQQGHQQPMYGMNPGMSPGPQYGNVAPIYAQQPPGGMPIRGYGGPNQFGTSPQQIHNFGPQHRNNHQNSSYGNKNYQAHNQHANGPTNSQIPTGPQARAPEANEESK